MAPIRYFDLFYSSGVSFPDLNCWHFEISADATPLNTNSGIPTTMETFNTNPTTMESVKISAWGDPPPVAKRKICKKSGDW